MKVERYALTDTPPQVRSLFDALGLAESSWSWFEVLAETTLAAGEKAEIFALFDNGEVAVAAIPGVTVRGKFVRGLTAPYTTLFAPPLGNEEFAHLLGRHLAQVTEHFRLDCLDGAAGTVMALQAGLAAAGAVATRYRHFVNWFEHIDAFDAYWQERPSQLKATLRRKSTPLLRNGHLHFAEIDLVSDWKKGAEIYQSVYAKSWKDPEPHPGFVDALFAKLGPPGIARLGVATIEGIPAAVQIWLVRQRRATIFKLAHDPAFDRHSPGTLLTHWFLGQLCEKGGVREVDFGRGNDAYKRQWLRSRRDRCGIVAANPRTVKGLAAIIFDILPSSIARHFRQKAGKHSMAPTPPASRDTNLDPIGT